MRHLLSTQDLGRADAVRILDTAAQMAATQSREIKLPTLRGRTVVNLFYEDSTRTRISFETAAKRLSADVINFSAKGSSVSRASRSGHGADAPGDGRGRGRRAAPGVGRPAPARARGLARRGRRQRGRRHAPAPDAGAPRRVHPAPPPHRDGPDLPGASGPDDAAARGAGLDGRHVAIVGDVLHSRVARSNVHLLHTLGARVTLVAPPTLLPVGVRTWPCEVSYDLDATLAGHTAHGGPDAVMMLRVQRERMSGAGAGAGPSSRTRSSTAASTGSTPGASDSSPSTPSSCTPAP